MSYGLPDVILSLSLIVCQRNDQGKNVQCSPEFVAWLQDGKYLKKRNTFTDVVASAEHLIAEKYTSKDKLCIQASSSATIAPSSVKPSICITCRWTRRRHGRREIELPPISALAYIKMPNPHGL